MTTPLKKTELGSIRQESPLHPRWTTHPSWLMLRFLSSENRHLNHQRTGSLPISANSSGSLWLGMLFIIDNLCATVAGSSAAWHRVADWLIVDCLTSNLGLWM